MVLLIPFHFDPDPVDGLDLDLGDFSVARISAEVSSVNGVPPP